MAAARVVETAQPAGFVRVGTLRHGDSVYLVCWYVEDSVGWIVRERLENGHAWSRVF